MNLSFRVFRASVQIREYQLKDVAKILMKVDHDEIVNKRHQVDFK